MSTENNTGKGRKSKGLNGYEQTVFSKRLKALHENTNEKQADTAANLGVTRQSFNNWLNAVNEPDFATLIKIAKYYNTSVDYLLGLSDIESLDSNIKTSCTTTGLSQAAVEKLSAHKIKKSITSQIIESKEFWDIIQSIQSALINYDTLAPSGKILADTAAGQMGIKVNWNDGKTTDLSKLPTEYLKYLGVVATEGATPIYKHLLTESISKLFDRIIEQNKKEV